MKINKKTKHIPESSIINGKITNFDLLHNGTIENIGYSSLRGYIKILKEQNKKLKKMGYKVTFTITLPIHY